MGIEAEAIQYVGCAVFLILLVVAVVKLECKGDSKWLIGLET